MLSPVTGPGWRASRQLSTCPLLLSPLSPLSQHQPPREDTRVAEQSRMHQALRSRLVDPLSSSEGGAPPSESIRRYDIDQEWLLEAAQQEPERPAPLAAFHFGQKNLTPLLAWRPRPRGIAVSGLSSCRLNTIRVAKTWRRDADLSNQFEAVDAPPLEGGSLVCRRSIPSARLAPLLRSSARISRPWSKKRKSTTSNDGALFCKEQANIVMQKDVEKLQRSKQATVSVLGTVSRLGHLRSALSKDEQDGKYPQVQPEGSQAIFGIFIGPTQLPLYVRSSSFSFSSSLQLGIPAGFHADRHPAITSAFRNDHGHARLTTPPLP
ncbi:hypothetical protein BU23DRAFT_563879 [Bimuria novae-zelandiae CBS 107.79]|uniref:Uncharacterized protein n=1 Tax=Bimuria novae-zelandiae CBS 107.79 TaxID=1447943 RepID=A0A6A5VR36_9PLEO|nr:hypothetical protein BU23DRAFT_563879 [Bimuria novae-zelandiae CBS 107.79]